MAYTDVNDDAAWRQTEGQTLPWDYAPAYSLLEGFRPPMIHGDILHVYHLGTGRDLVGSALVLMAQRSGIFEGNNIPDRLSAATVDLKEYCKAHGLPLKLHKLSKTKLNWKSGAMPELLSSGYDTFVVNRWLVDICSRFPEQIPEDLRLALWSADHVLSLLSSAGRWLTEHEQRHKEQLGDVFMRAYLSLAQGSIQAGRRLFRLRPKLHIWHHVLKASPRSRLNDHVYATWMDEDALRKLMKLHRITSKKTAGLRILQRYLMGLPKIWNQKRGR